MRILFLGDIVGRPGCRAVYEGLPALRAGLSADLVIANGENAADGLGLSAAIYTRLRTSGVDVVTTGNHIWQNSEILPLLDSEERLLRPENYPLGVAGHGVALLTMCGVEVAVVNLEGRRSLSSLRCPFVTGDEVLARLSGRAAVVFVDFHAESPDEKEALGVHLDGRVCAVVGTHTHVQTADERLLPGSTGYLTDAGMCGSASGVIGMDPELSVRRYVSQMPLKMEVDRRPGLLCGAIVVVDGATGRCSEIRRIRV